VLENGARDWEAEREKEEKGIQEKLAIRL